MAEEQARMVVDGEPVDRVEGWPACLERFQDAQGYPRTCALPADHDGDHASEPITPAP